MMIRELRKELETLKKKIKK